MRGLSDDVNRYQLEFPEKIRMAALEMAVAWLNTPGAKRNLFETADDFVQYINTGLHPTEP